MTMSAEQLRILGYCEEAIRRIIEIIEEGKRT